MTVTSESSHLKGRPASFNPIQIPLHKFLLFILQSYSILFSVVIQTEVTPPCTAPTPDVVFLCLLSMSSSVEFLGITKILLNSSSLKAFPPLAYYVAFSSPHVIQSCGGIVGSSPQAIVGQWPAQQ